MNNDFWPAPAKLNRFLHITGRRPDGYHEIQTVFHLLDWGDTLELSVTDDGQIRRSRAVTGVQESDDLCIRAARLLKSKTGCRKGAVISLYKNIPLGSGLGGGSSDAATVLHALNRLWGCDLGLPELAGLGLELGADVPLFVHGSSAWAEGVGEQLQPVSLGETWFVLVFPPFSISTKAVFSDPALRRDHPPIRFDNQGFADMSNDCEPVVLERYPEMRKIMQDLSAWGTPRLTGTGSCIFFEARGKNWAEDATLKLKSRYNVRAVRGRDFSPLLEKLSKAG